MKHKKDNFIYAQFELDGKLQIGLYVPHDWTQLALIMCVESWIPRTTEYTSQSIVDYINSKSHMTLEYALTPEQYSKLK